MLNVSGHLLSTAEIEACLLSHGSILAEAAVVSKSHPVKGQALYCFVVPTIDHVPFGDEQVAALKEKGGDIVQNVSGHHVLRSASIYRHSHIYNYP
jgi:acetyl-CoA synthetase